MSCTAYRLFNGTSSPITQSFADCNSSVCNVVVSSGATKYYITADSATFVANPAFTTVTTYGTDRAFSFSSCCTNDVFHILGDVTTLTEGQIGLAICVNELTNANDCTINNILVKGCYEFVSIDDNIGNALGDQVYLEYQLGFDDCNDCLTSWGGGLVGCIPCCKCYQVDIDISVTCDVSYTDCDTGITNVVSFSGLNNYICSATVPSGSCGVSMTLTDLGPCSTTEPCGPCYSSYCITNTGNAYDDNYTLDGNYDGYSYWISSSGTYYIYYNTIDKQWCLSDSLGGACLLSGKSPCFSTCPDLCGEYFFEGSCPTTTTTTVACMDFDFDAIFDCMVEPTPSPTPTPSITPTMTVTPSSTNYCSMVSVDATIDTYSPTPTPTPTVTPSSSPIIIRPCNVLGDVSFTTLDGHISCPSSKQFQDCVTGMMYYTTELVPTPSGDTLIEFMIFKAYVDNALKCISFVGINDNIIGVNTIELVEGPTGYSNLGECVLCEVVPSPTPTPTPTMTPTPSGIPCFCYELIGEESTTFNYIDCNGRTKTAISKKSTPTYVCSLTTPTTTSLNPYSLTKLGICADGVCPPLICNCYTVSNGGAISELDTLPYVYMFYTDCNNVQQVIVINDYTSTPQFCSLTTPFIYSSINIITITLVGDCASCFP